MVSDTLTPMISPKIGCMVVMGAVVTNIWVISDTHFGHSNILRFTDDKGELIRGKRFKNITEHDNYMINQWHDLIKPEDHVYHLGDVVMARPFLPLLKNLPGHKRLVRGNHDIFKTKEYIDVGFSEIYGVRVFAPNKLVLSHIPIHPGSLKEGWTNIHGHTHSNVVRLHNGEPDLRYQCVSVEHTNYSPILIMR